MDLLDDPRWRPLKKMQASPRTIDTTSHTFWSFDYRVYVIFPWLPVYQILFRGGVNILRDIPSLPNPSSGIPAHHSIPGLQSYGTCLVDYFCNCCHTSKNNRRSVPVLLRGRIFYGPLYRTSRIRSRSSPTFLRQRCTT